MKEIIKRIHVKRQMKRKITNLCMLEISPRIYQNHHVSAVPVSTHYFALTVGFQSANGVGGLWGGRGWKTWKKNIAVLLPNWLFALALLQYFFFQITPFCFFLPFCCCCILPLSTASWSIFFLSLCHIFPIFLSNGVWNERIRASCMKQMWLYESTNQKAASPLLHRIVADDNRSLKSISENTSISRKIVDVDMVLYGEFIFKELNLTRIVTRKTKQKVSFFCFNHITNCIS